MSRKAMQMALEALEDANDVARMEFSDENYYSEAINALRQALETEQEPVAWMHTTGTGHVYFRKKPQDKVFNPQPVYTSPKREWVGLTDEEISDLWCKVSNTDFVTIDTHEFARAIEAKLKEKNT